MATTVMLDGIKTACKSWGRAVYWMLTADGEGYPGMTTFQRAKEGDLDWSAVRSRRQHFGEVMLGDALAVSRAIKLEPMMPEELYRALFMHYVVPRRDPKGRLIKAEIKARELGYGNVRDYWRTLEGAHHFLLGRIAIEPAKRAS